MNLAQVGRYGELRLRFEHSLGRTRLTENYSCPPLQVMRAIDDSANCLCVYLLSPTGGVVQDDHYHLHLTLEPHSHALFTTVSATKIYKMPHGCATQDITIDLQADSFLEFVPDANILFRDSDFSQTVRIRLEERSLCLFQEVVMPGRLASDEALQFRRYANRLCVQDAQGLLLVDNSTLEPHKTDLTRIGILESYPCWGTLYLLGDLAHWGIALDQFMKRQNDLLGDNHQLVSLSTLYRNGIVFKMLGQRLEDIYAIFRQFREILREEFLGLPNAPLRK